MYAWSFDGFNIVYRSQPKVIGFLAQDLAVVSVAGARQESKSSRRCGARVKISGVVRERGGANVSISADLDHLLKEGEP